MLKFIYLAIVAFLLSLIIINMFKKKDENSFKNVVFFQIDCALVMVTLFLRLFLLK